MVLSTYLELKWALFMNLIQRIWLRVWLSATSLIFLLEYRRKKHVSQSFVLRLLNRVNDTVYSPSSFIDDVRKNLRRLADFTG